MSQEVFDLVDNQSLAKCQEVSLPWYEFLQKQKFREIRVIKSILEPFHEVDDNWKKVFKSATTQNVMDLGLAVRQFYQTTQAICHFYQIKGSSLHHVVAGFGNLALFTMIEKICPLKYSEDINNNLKPIHIAAQYGQLEVLKYIFNKIEDKYPKSHDCAVPLHFAAKGGNLENCEFLIKNVSDINPVNLIGWTPLHFAVKRGHLSICHLFLENGVNKSSRTTSGFTPIHIAAQHGHFKVYEYLFSKTLDANSSADAANNGWTALHSAAQEGHIQICKFIMTKIVNKNPRRESDGIAPLHIAASKGNIELCRTLMKDNQIVNPIDNFGFHTTT